METSHKSLGSYKFTDGWHPLDQMEINSARHTKSREEALQAIRSLRMANPIQPKHLTHHAHTHHPCP